MGDDEPCASSIPLPISSPLHALVVDGSNVAQTLANRKPLARTQPFRPRSRQVRHPARFIASRSRSPPRSSSLTNPPWNPLSLCARLLKNRNKLHRILRKPTWCGPIVRDLIRSFATRPSPQNMSRTQLQENLHRWSNRAMRKREEKERESVVCVPVPLHRLISGWRGRFGWASCGVQILFAFTPINERELWHPPSR